MTAWSWFRHSATGIALIYFLTAFLIRLPFFFRDYVDRDESTFILVAQSWVDGFLPYTQLWDLKPPLVFAFFAGIISLFGKSFIAIRLSGVILVAATAFTTYLMSRRLGASVSAFWAGMGCIYLLSLFGSLQGVMSEHLSMFFFMPALYLLFREQSPERILISGLLFGMALMTKLNLAYPVALIGAMLVLESFRKSAFLDGIARGFLFAISISLVIGGFYLPYGLEGKTELWWDSVFMAPLAYSSGEGASVLNVAPLLILVAAFLILSFRKGWLKLQHSRTQLVVVAICGVVISFLKVGRVNGHYLIQLYPLLLLLLALVLHRSLPRKWRYVLPVLAFLLPLESYKEYADVYEFKQDTGSYYNGEGIWVPEYLQQHDLSSSSILFLEYHIGYWPLGTYPPVPSATHPSNICREELFPFYDNPRETGLGEIRYIMEELQPETVVIRRGRPVFDRDRIEENNYINAYLALHYNYLEDVGDARILQRL